MLELFRSPRRAIVWFVETSMLALLVVFAAGLSIGWARALGYEQCLSALLVSAIAQASIYYHGLYGPERRAPRALVVGFLRALGVAAAALWILLCLLPHDAIGRGVAVSALGVATVILPAWRALYQRVACCDRLRRPTLILGGSALARECAALVRERDELGLKLAGVVLAEGEQPPPGAAVLGRSADLRRVCEVHRIGMVVVAASDRRGRLPVEDLLELKLRGVTVEDGAQLYERVTGKVFVPDLKPSQIIFARDFRIRRRTLALKRALDVILSAVGLVLGAPLLALAAIAVKLDSPGPVIYSQLRLGARGRPFRIYKIRSMCVDAEAHGAVWAAERDPRVTRVGRLLRRSRIDELPQLWNVLVGDMSLVGPRPERPVFTEQLEKQIPFFRQRLAIKPGLTGHAQVRCRYGASTEDALEKLQYDLFYIKGLSLWFDLSILIDTVKVVLLRIGSR